MANTRNDTVAIMAAIIYASRTSQPAVSVGRNMEDEIASEAWDLVGAVERCGAAKYGHT